MIREAILIKGGVGSSTKSTGNTGLVLRGKVNLDAYPKQRPEYIFWWTTNIKLKIKPVRNYRWIITCSLEGEKLHKYPMIRNYLQECVFIT